MMSKKSGSLVLSVFYIFRDVVLVIAILAIFLFLPLAVAVSPTVRGQEHGLIFFILLWCLPWALLFRGHQLWIAAKFFSHRTPPADQFPIPFQLLFRAAPFLFLMLLAFPFVSQAGKEAIDPVSYWKEKAAEKNTCTFSRDTIQDQRERVIVAANKLNLGIGTTQELRDAKASLDFTAGIFDECDARYARNIEQANSELNQLVIAAKGIPTLAREVWGDYDATSYEYRLRNGSIQRLKK